MAGARDRDLWPPVRRDALLPALLCTVVALGLLVTMPATKAGFTGTTSTALSVQAGILGTPTDVDCDFTGANAVAVSWTNAAGGLATGHAVLRGDAPGGPYSSVTTVSANATSGNDLNPAPPTSRYYVVRDTASSWTGPTSSEVATTSCRLAVATVAGVPGVWCCGANDGGAATAGRIWGPNDVAVNAAGDVYIAEKSGGRIRKVSAATGNITTFAGDGATAACSYSGPASGVQLNNPIGIDVDLVTGTVYVADTGNNCVRAITASGTVSQVAGSQGAASTCASTPAPTALGLNAPYDVTFHGGDLFISDTGSNCVRRVTGATSSGTVSPFVAGSPVAGSDQCSWSGSALQAQLSYPVTLAFDAVGNGYLADADHDCVRKIDTNGVITRYAGVGNGQAGTSACTYSGSSPASMRMDNPFGLVVDAAGTLFVVDNFLHCVVKITASGQVSNVGFSGVAASYAGDGGWAPAAEANYPCGAALTAAGDLLVADANNHVVRRVRRP